QSSLITRTYPSFPTRRSSDLILNIHFLHDCSTVVCDYNIPHARDKHLVHPSRAYSRPDNLCNYLSGHYVASLGIPSSRPGSALRSEEHTSELQSLRHIVCRLL